jgi:zinc D-Ala-D-Ala carboxypeptidase
MLATDKLSPHFTFGELTSTNQSTLLEANRKQAIPLIKAGTALANEILEPIRAKFGPVIIHSGFRGPTLNEAIGGSKTSQHMKFEAADFHCANATLQQVFDWIRKESGLRYGQVILEGRQPGKPTWIHVSLGEPWRDAKSCRQAMVFDGSKYTNIGTK